MTVTGVGAFGGGCPFTGEGVSVGVHGDESWSGSGLEVTVAGYRRPGFLSEPVARRIGAREVRRKGCVCVCVSLPGAFGTVRIWCALTGLRGARCKAYASSRVACQCRTGYGLLGGTARRHCRQGKVRNLGIRIGLVPILPGIRPGFDSYLGRDSSPRPPVWSARTHREGVPVAGACQWMMNRRASAGG